MYALARHQGRAFFKTPIGRELLSVSAIARLERVYERHGAYGIFFSRLLPVWRAVVAPFAGIAGLSPARALIPVALASGLWYGALTLFVVRLGTNLDVVVAEIGKVNRVLGISAFVVLVVVAGVVWWRMKKKR